MDELSAKGWLYQRLNAWLAGFLTGCTTDWCVCVCLSRPPGCLSGWLVWSWMGTHSYTPHGTLPNATAASGGLRCFDPEGVRGKGRAVGVGGTEGR